MSGDYFVDTNVLVYARDAGYPDKQRRATRWIGHLWENECGVISTQVLKEYYAVVTSKLDPGLSNEEAREDVSDLWTWDPVKINRQVMETAWRIEDAYRFSWWDSLILAAADLAGCSFVLTEDLQANQTVRDLEIVNPFDRAPTE